MMTETDQASAMRLVRDVEECGSNCVEKLIRTIVDNPVCSSAGQLIASTAALDGALPAEVVGDVLALPSPCATTLVAAAGAIPDPDAQLANEIVGWMLSRREPAARAGALVTLGSLAHHARERGRKCVADHVDGLLAAELLQSTSSEVENVQRLEAAGNAGCAPCAVTIRAALRDRSSETRRAAVGALRFIEKPDAVSWICGVLARDADLDVREQAAWALGWTRHEPTTRVQCLVRSAARDGSAKVRIAAARALTELAKEVPMAREALLQLTSDEYGDTAVAALAVSVVSVLPPPQTSSEISLGVHRTAVF